MKKQLLAATLALVFGGAALADERPYTDGSVWDLAMIRTTDGMSDQYLDSLRANYKPILEEAKKQGLVLSYKIISTTNSGPDDWDLLLMTEYKNWAARDGLSEKFEVIQRKVMSKKQEDKLMEQRLQVRRFVGNKSGQEILLK